MVLKVEVPDKSFWPGQLEAWTLCDEQEIHSLAKSLGESAREAVEQFRDYKLQGTPQVKTLERLCIASHT